MSGRLHTAPSGRRPAVKLAIKPAGRDAPKDSRIYIAAAWRRDDGRLGSLLPDREVEQIAIKMRDGRVIRMTQSTGEDGKPRWSHYLDVFLETPETAPAPRHSPQPLRDDFPPDDDGGTGDLPF